ncbi:MAG TPA: hypothetical protein VJQ26_06775 [Ktedonobacteraceae bacterium]|nr:hypothetical protein [Ktedonobacteraceae bacterium]
METRLASSKRIRGLSRSTHPTETNVSEQSPFADERSHQNTHLQLTFAAGYTLSVVHSLSFRRFSWNQATSSLSPDPLAVTSASQQALLT